MRMLEVLGVDEQVERLYLGLVEQGPSTLASLTARLQMAAATAADAVNRLTALGLITVRGNELTALPPSPALEQLADEHARAARSAAESARQLSEWWSRNNFQVGYADFLRTADSCRSTEVRLISQAKNEVISLTSAPVADDDAPPVAKVPPADITSAFHGAITSGVSFRGVYSHSLLRAEASRHAVLERQNAGEQVRLFTELPLSLTIADGEQALVAYPASRHDEYHSLLVRPSGLLDLLISVFETFWGIASPLRGPDQRPADLLGPDEQELLRYLMLGVTDAAIARELGISERTVTRRVARLQDLLGVRTRFQLGAQANERGLI